MGNLDLLGMWLQALVFLSGFMVHVRLCGVIYQGFPSWSTKSPNTLRLSVTLTSLLPSTPGCSSCTSEPSCKSWGGRAPSALPTPTFPSSMCCLLNSALLESLGNCSFLFLHFLLWPPLVSNHQARKTMSSQWLYFSPANDPEFKYSWPSLEYIPFLNIFSYFQPTDSAGPPCLSSQIHLWCRILNDQTENAKVSIQLLLMSIFFSKPDCPVKGLF